MLASAGCSGGALISAAGPGGAQSTSFDVQLVAQELAIDIQRLEQAEIAELSTETRGGGLLPAAAGLPKMQVKGALVGVALRFPMLGPRNRDTAHKIIGDLKKSGAKVIDSKVTVASVKRTSEDSETIHADLSLLYERPLQYSTIVDFKEVIPHRVTIDKSSGKIIKSERLDMDWQIANAVSDQTAAGLVPGVGSDSAEPLVVRPMTTAETSKVANVRSSAYAVGRGVMPQGISSATAVNRTNAINYARAWWNKRNGAYTGYPVDCTAFVSQAMRAGGWQWVNYGNNHTADSAWWDRNNLLIPRASYTYGGAENFFRFGRNSSQRLFPVTQASQLIPGDILQYKVKGSDALMDHTMIVTKKVGSEVFLTYHTTDTLDKPFSQMSSSNVEWYAHGHR